MKTDEFELFNCHKQDKKVFKLTHNPDYDSKAGATKRAFIVMVRRGMSINAICKHLDISSTVIYYWRKHDDKFRLAWDEAIDDAIVALEQIAIARCAQGSDAMIQFMLKHRLKSRYGEDEKQVAPTTQPITINVIPPAGIELPTEEPDAGG